MVFWLLAWVEWLCKELRMHIHFMFHRPVVHEKLTRIDVPCIAKAKQSINFSVAVASFTCSGCWCSSECNSADIGRWGPSTLSKYTCIYTYTGIRRRSLRVPPICTCPDAVCILLADATLHKFSANEFNLRNACGWVPSPKWKWVENGLGLVSGLGFGSAGEGQE